MVSAKGKEKVTDGGGGKGKRKWNANDDKTGQKRKNRSVLQFFEDTTYQVDDDNDSSDDDSIFDDDGDMVRGTDDVGTSGICVYERNKMKFGAVEGQID
ncbi:hypothetical protein BUALT_Bualt10G0082100 [Buddleja alternifolia]|uniref:Uncharacterized protein n=1 Tax=Buddleja alternifolia TaxID=168488 RepID=A0AAV6WXQ5_9LAMI|nr:hypothetical protein BUALT_Bualt10G0082100 [Buddleja alternifolia]